MLKLSIFAAALLASTAVAQTSTASSGGGAAPQLPQCAGSCVTSSFGDCGFGEYECICKNTVYLDALACCVGTQCPVSDQDAALEFAKNLCGAQGVATTYLPAAATCGPGGLASANAALSSQAAAGSAGGAASTSSPSTAATMATTMTSGSAQMTSVVAATTASAATTSSSAAAHHAGIDVGLGALVMGVMAAL